MKPPQPRSTLFPYTTLFRSARDIEDIEGLRIALHFDKMNVLGHSYGGVVAQGYALKYPQHVKHLILANTRSEEHTSELQSRRDLVCRLLLEKKKKEEV